jgi:hypothetical protein
VYRASPHPQEVTVVAVFFALVVATRELRRRSHA